MSTDDIERAMLEARLMDAEGKVVSLIVAEAIRLQREAWHHQRLTQEGRIRTAIIGTALIVASAMTVIGATVFLLTFEAYHHNPR